MFESTPLDRDDLVRFATLVGMLREKQRDPKAGEDERRWFEAKVDQALANWEAAVEH